MKTQTNPSRVAFIKACWHQDIVDQALHGFRDALVECGAKVDITEYAVPGSLEIPLQCQRLAGSGNFDLIVAAGLIVDGGIYRHDFVASTVLDGMMRVQLDTDVPILSVVLTPHHFNDGPEHRQFFFEHFRLKGEEAARACVQTLDNLVTGQRSEAA